MNRQRKTEGASSHLPEAVTQRSVRLDGTEWNPAEFTLAVSSISDVTSLSNDDLFGVCRGAHHCYQFHYLADFQPFFLELWKRIEARSIPNIPTKREACRLIGCSLRWAEEIVAGTAHDPKRALKPEPTDKEIALEINRYADETLSVVKAEDRILYLEICGRLANHFDKQATHGVHSGGPEAES